MRLWRGALWVVLIDTAWEHDVRNIQVFRSFCGGHQINAENLLDTFCNHLAHINDSYGSLYLRVAHVSVLYGLLFAYDALKIVIDWAWALVDYLETIDRATPIYIRFWGIIRQSANQLLRAGGDVICLVTWGYTEIWEG